jgi:hypothetical protein
MIDELLHFLRTVRSPREISTEGSGRSDLQRLRFVGVFRSCPSVTQVFAPMEASPHLGQRLSQYSLHGNRPAKDVGQNDRGRQRWGSKSSISAAG